MNDGLREVIAYYQSLGVPQDQHALIQLLKQVQSENGGAIPKSVLSMIADACNVKDSYLLAIVRRIPSLRLSDTHLLEICAGPNCRKHAALAAFTQTLQSERITVKFVPCMRFCGKGPNVKWDGNLYHCADENLLRKLTEE